MRNLEFFIGASPEHARICPDQLLILMDHVRCAAFELPFSPKSRSARRTWSRCSTICKSTASCIGKGTAGHWIADSYPASRVSLRSVTDGNFVVVDVTEGKQEVIAEVDYSSAALTLYEGAIYLIQASPWQVEKPDWRGRKAFVTKTRADYYTEAIDFSRLKILDQVGMAIRHLTALDRGLPIRP